MKNKPSLAKVGRRTGVSVLTGKYVERKEDGTDNFEDYWTDSSSEFSDSPSKSLGNGILSFRDSSGESSAQNTPVRPYLTRRTEGVLKTPSATKRNANTSPLANNVAKNTLGKHQITYNTRSAQTSLKKSAYSGGADGSSAESLSNLQSPRRRLILDRTVGAEPVIQSLLLERTMVDKSINTSEPFEALQRQNTESRELPFQTASTSLDEEAGEIPSRLTAIPSQLQVQRHLNFDSPKSVRRVSMPKRFDQEKTRVHKSIGTSPSLMSLTNFSAEESNVSLHVTDASFDRENSSATVRLKYGKRISGSKTSVPEDSGSNFNVETQNVEGGDRLNPETPKHLKKASKSHGFVQVKNIIDESINTAPVLQSSSQLQDVNSSNAPSHMAGTPSDQERNRHGGKRLRSGEKISFSRKSALDDSVMLGSVEMQNEEDVERLHSRSSKSGKRISKSKNSILENSGRRFNVETRNEEGGDILNTKSPKHGKRVSKSNSFAYEKTLVDETINTAQALQGSSFQLQDDINLSKVPSHITGMPSDDQEGNIHMEKRLRAGERSSASKKSTLEDSVMQGSAEMQNEEQVERLHSQIPKSGKRISKSKNSILENSGRRFNVETQNEEGGERLNTKSPKHGKRVSKPNSFAHEKTFVDETINTAQALQGSSFQLQDDINLSKVQSHITGMPSDDQEGNRHMKKRLRAGERSSASKKSALEDSVMQGSAEMQNEEHVERLHSQTPKSGKQISKSRIPINASSQITGTSPSDLNFKSGKIISRSKRLAIEDSIAQSDLQEMQNGGNKQAKKKKLRSFVLEKFLLNGSCNTSEVGSGQENAESVAEKESSVSLDGGENHRDETVHAASDDGSSNGETVGDKENASNGIQEEEIPSGRPRRNRMPPLAHWRNERRRFCYPSLGEIVDLGIDPGTQEDCEVIARMLKKKKKYKSRNGVTEAVDPPPDSPPNDSDEPVVFHDPATGEAVEVLLQSRFRKQKWTIPMSQDQGKPAYKVSHTMWSENMSFGYVEIAAKCKKGEQYSPDSSLHFVVLEGNLVFDIKQNLYKLAKYDTITVPVATPYSISNNGKNKAVLYFCSTALPFF